MSLNNGAKIVSKVGKKKILSQIFVS